MKKMPVSALLVISLLLASCETSAGYNTPDSLVDTINSSADIVTADTDGLLKNSGAISAVFDSDYTDIDLSAADGSTIITEGGAYRLTGELNGQVVINAKDAQVDLILDGASIYSADSAAIYVKKADSVTIVSAAGSENTLENGGSYITADGDDNNVDGAVFSKSDISFGGDGRLTIIAGAGHGVVSKDSLEIYGGTLDITAEKHGLTAKDSLAVDGGSITINSGHDGLHCENADDETLGYIYIKSGELSIVSGGDGISAGTSLQIDDGKIDITAGGGSSNAAERTHSDNDMPGRGFFGFPDSSGSSDSSDSTDNAASDENEGSAPDSTKGLKAGGDISVSGGSITIDSADDSVHSNGNIGITAGEFSLATGDDGIHADGSLVIDGGSIGIGTSYEGLEGKTIDINGGSINLSASDDGMNAAGDTASEDGSFFGRMNDQFAAQDGVYIRITGGLVRINAEGDGIDSNGDLIITGGETYVEGPTGSGDGALDYNGSAEITGGVVIAAGSSGMAEGFGDASTQGSIKTDTGTQASGSVVSITDSDGTVLAEHTFEKQFTNVVISCPGMVENGTYTLTAGDYSETITLDGITYGSSSGFGNFGGFGSFGGNDKPNGNSDAGRDMTPPDMPDGKMPDMPDGERPDFPDFSDGGKP